MKVIEKILTDLITHMSSLFGCKQVDPEKLNSLLQFVKFGIVGLSNTLISYFLYSGGLILFHRFELFEQADYFVAQAVAFVVSVAWSFYWNNKVVFGDTSQKWWSKLIKTYISYSFTGLFLSAFLLWIWIDYIGISEYIAPLINLAVTVPLNFMINKLWTYKC